MDIKDWITCINMLLSVEFGVKVYDVIIMKVSLSDDATFVTADIKGYGMQQIAVADALFTDWSGVHDLH